MGNSLNKKGVRISSKNVCEVEEQILSESTALPSVDCELALAKLMGITKRSNYTVIYNSQTDELSARCLNSRIALKSNVTLLMKSTTNELFGCFIPQVPKSWDKLKHFKTDYKLFVLNSKQNNPFELVERENLKNKFFSLQPNSSGDIVIEMSNSYSVTSNPPLINVSFLISNYYVNSSDISNHPFPVSLALEKLVAIQWF